VVSGYTYSGLDGVAYANQKIISERIFIDPSYAFKRLRQTSGDFGDLRLWLVGGCPVF
jgi:hypothetical protein